MMPSSRSRRGLVAFAAAVISFALPATAADVPNARALAPGDAAPAFSARTLAGGRPLSNVDFRGKVLVLNFWATWCPPCRAETPGLVAAYAKLAGPDVAFLGLDTTEVPSVVKTFVSAKSVRYPIALAGPEAYNAFGVAYIPTTVVIDAGGVVRARWTGELDPARLARFVADARAGTTFVLDTPEQQVLTRLLDPARYRFDGDAAGVGSEVARAQADVHAADALANARAGATATTIDYAALQTLEGNVLVPAAQAALRVAATSAERVAAERLVAAADGKLNRFADAVAALRRARADDPADATLLLDIAKADYRLHDYVEGTASAKAYTDAAPADAAGWDELALQDQRRGAFADAAPAYERDLALLRVAVGAAKSPSERLDASANVADSSLDLADVYVALGDVAGATRAFAQARAYADRLDPNGADAELVRNVRERTQEGLVAVRLARGDGKTALSLVPWTGPDLPGSLASTLKYRLIVLKRASSTVNLRVRGLARGWVASFCADGLCSPGRVSAVLPESGVKTYEFQLVPPTGVRMPGDVRIISSDGASARV